MTDARATTDGDHLVKVLRAIPPGEVLPAATKPFSDAVSLRLAPDDGMYADDDAHYYECGASALNIILAALQLAESPAPRSILDFGAGAGRVTRWLRAAFPAAMIAACDLRKEDMEFCRAEFRAETWTSGTDIEALRAPGTYHLIWVGSVLTHLSAENAGRLIEKLLSWTNPGGLLVMSTMGRVARMRGDNGEVDYIHPEAWEEIKKTYATLGFGYADYAGEAGYGVSLTKLSWLGNLVENLPTARLILLSEGLWDGLHDIVAIQNSASPELQDRAATSRSSTRDSVTANTTSQSPSVLVHREGEIAALRAHVAALEASASWRLTRPLRAAMRLLRR